MFLDMLLGGGIAATSATQLRIPGVPVGPGELCLALWIGLTCVRLLLNGASPQVPALAMLGAFWGFFAFALSVGAFVGILIDPRFSLVRMIYDSTAYLLVATLTLLSVMSADALFRFRRAAWMIIAFSTAGVLLQLADGFGFVRIPDVAPWYWDRFRGWSENPNQVAITSCVTCLLALHLAATANGASRIFGVLAAITAFIAGRLSKSDTFIIVMVLIAVLLLAFRVRRWLAPEYSSSFRHTLALLIVVGVGPLSLSVAPYLLSRAGTVEHLALAFSKDKGGEATEQTFSLRLHLWDQALESGLESGSLGLGPGPHLEAPADAGGRDRPLEAHRTPLDIFLQGGLAAVIALAVLMGSTIWLVYRARMDILAALLIAISIFGGAHFLLRHPIIWFVLAFCIAFGCAAANSPQPRMAR
jgi:hypothetical protein